jgi:YYY domain-containing protein
MMATLFAVSFMLAYTIAQHLFEIYEQNANKGKIYKHARTISGLLAGALVTLSGSLHTPIYAWFFQSQNPINGRYWFPDATRYIGHNPKVEMDGTIHEFPLYSYVVSDLHAHVLNMIFVLTVLGTAIATCMWILKRIRNEKTEGWKQYIPSPGFWLTIFLIGLFPACNFWDFPIYIVVTTAIYFYANIRAYEYKLKAIFVTICQALFTAAVSYGVVFPFHMNFDVISSQIKFVSMGSKFYQLLVLYGYQAAFFVMLVILVFAEYKAKQGEAALKKGKYARRGNAVDSLPRELLSIQSIVSKRFDLFEKVNPADVLVIILFICAIGLIAVPEIIYVKDIYPSNPRANTMFKLTYQAFIMLTISIGYTFPRLFLHTAKQDVREAAFNFIGVVFLIGAFAYPFYAISGWYGSLHFSNYKGLDGIAFMQTYSEDLTKVYRPAVPEGQDDPDPGPIEYSLDDDYEIVQYINNNIAGQPVIAEANHLSYTSFGRIAAATGCPDIFNWYTHQQLWRNEDHEAFNERVHDVETLYTGDEAGKKSIIEKYNVEYIVLGKLERAKFKDYLNEDVVKSMGEVVFQKNETVLIKV